MTRDKLIAIAAALAQATAYCETRDQRRGVERSVLCISAALANENPCFDRTRFLAACGVVQS